MAGQYEKKWGYFSLKNVYFSNSEAFWETRIHNQWEKINTDASPGLSQGTQHTAQKVIPTADHFSLSHRYVRLV